MLLCYSLWPNETSYNKKKIGSINIAVKWNHNIQLHTPFWIFALEHLFSVEEEKKKKKWKEPSNVPSKISVCLYLYSSMYTVLYLEVYRHFQTGYDKERKEKEKERKSLLWNLGPLGRLV